jgi:hypothetical protein
MLVNYIRTALAVKLNELKVDRRAVTAIEYALIAALRYAFGRSEKTAGGHPAGRFSLHVHHSHAKLCGAAVFFSLRGAVYNVEMSLVEVRRVTTCVYMSLLMFRL